MGSRSSYCHIPTGKCGSVWKWGILLPSHFIHFEPSKMIQTASPSELGTLRIVCCFTCRRKIVLSSEFPPSLSTPRAARNASSGAVRPVAWTGLKALGRWRFPKMGVPLIQVNRIFHYKSSILGIPHLWNPPCLSIPLPSFTGTKFWVYHLRMYGTSCTFHLFPPVPAFSHMQIQPNCCLQVNLRKCRPTSILKPGTSLENGSMVVSLCFQDLLRTARWLFAVRLGGSRRTVHPPFLICVGIILTSCDIIIDNQYIMRAHLKWDV